MRVDRGAFRGFAAAAAISTASLSVGHAAQPAKAAASSFICPADAKAAPLDFTLKDANGKDVRLSSFKGRVILLDFWATWCAPCKVEIPWFVDYQTRFGPRGLQVLGVSVDEDASLLKPYIARMKMNYPVLLGANREDIQKAYGPLEVFPTTLLINREGRVCATHYGLSAKESFDAQLASLLGSTR